MVSDLKNEAAWLIGEKVTPLEVRPGPTPQPAVDEVVIKVAYAAVNPTDFKVLQTGYMI
jgi:NADPH:quinone reductase-like Zn-dependent oxidoreductase